MKIKKGDKVIVIAGKDKGKTGKVVRAFPRIDKVIVEKVNVLKKHQRSRKSSEKGQIIEKATPIHVSNVSLIDPDTGKRTRSRRIAEKAKKTKASKKRVTK